jgi:hypothetical protein
MPLPHPYELLACCLIKYSDTWPYSTRADFNCHITNYQSEPQVLRCVMWESYEKQFSLKSRNFVLKQFKSVELFGPAE